MTHNGFEIIRSYLRDMPSTPGVYRMTDEAGNALYVGKAKNLKNRVSNYVTASGLSMRIMRMVSLTHAMEIVTTKTEAEALLLESNLIKKLKPRYNILLRDDKSFPYILLTEGHPFPQLLKYRGAQKPKGEYFGPFASASAVNETLTILQKLFLLRSCSDSIFASRTRPCLQYQIKRCTAPCVGYVNEADYAAQIDQARQFLKGKSREVQQYFAKQMQQASDAMEYEKAASFRDRIAVLTRVQHEQRIIADTMQDADVVALYREGEQACVQVFFFRGGQNYGNKAYFPAHVAEASEEDILTAFMGQFYASANVPKMIVVSHPLTDCEWLEAALEVRAGSKVQIHHPQRGEKREVMDQALNNAREALLRHLSQHASNTALLEKVGELFGMDAPPVRIEVYDNSHIAGSHMVGAMICAGREGFEKKHYRRFNIESKQLALGDDYAMLREVLTRRFTRLQKEDASRSSDWPDLVLIDGGAGQLSVATEVFADLGISGLAYVAISKGPDRNAGREWFHQPGRDAFQLEPNTPVLHYLQRLRDEAHRFAIGSHRIKRSNAIKESSLNAIPGIGALRKRALLKHFGSAREVENATVDELCAVPGISHTMAYEIYSFFRR